MVNLLNNLKRRCVCAKGLDTPYDFGAGTPLSGCNRGSTGAEPQFANFE
jgi:hypothetical protein